MRNVGGKTPKELREHADRLTIGKRGEGVKADDDPTKRKVGAARSDPVEAAAAASS